MTRIILAAGIAITVGCAVATMAVAQSDRPWFTKLKTTGWYPQVGDAERWVLTGEMLAPGETTRRWWFRYEYGTPQKVGGIAYRSLAVFREYDCKGRRVQDLQSSAFSGNNFDTFVASFASNRGWEYPIPGTEDRKWVEIACSSAVIENPGRGWVPPPPNPASPPPLTPPAAKPR